MAFYLQMERLKTEYELQTQRKIKRQTTFDTNRDLDQIVLERDNLRELSSSLRWLLNELAKCVSFCDEGMNNTLLEELQKHGIDTKTTKPNETNDELNDSIDSEHSVNLSKDSRVRFVPDVSGILNVVEDPSLMEYVCQSNESSFNLNECVDRLKTEAVYLLELSEQFCRNNKTNCKANVEKDDSCEEDDGLKKKRNKLEQTSSLNENLLNGRGTVAVTSERRSLPNNFLSDRSVVNSELNVKLNDLKNRLLLSEKERKHLETQLADTMKKHDNLAQILCMAKEHLEHLEAQKEDISEGYGISQLKSPSRQPGRSGKTTYSELQNTARSILNGAPNSSGTNKDGTVLLQQIEDFCSKLDRFVEEEERGRCDLQEQVINIKHIVLVFLHFFFISAFFFKEFKFFIIFWLCTAHQLINSI